MPPPYFITWWLLKNVNFEVAEGEIVSITGPSGSGKTTLLNIIALIDSLDLGRLNVFGEDLSNLSEKEKSVFRKKNFGFVYQSNNLFEDFSAIENVALPLILNGYKKNDAYNESESILLPPQRNSVHCYFVHPKVCSNNI